MCGFNDSEKGEGGVTSLSPNQSRILTTPSPNYILALTIPLTRVNSRKVLSFFAII